MALVNKKELVEQVSKLDRNECGQLLRIIRKHGLKYTENSNGCWVNISGLDDGPLQEIVKFVRMCFDVHRENENRDQQLRELTEEFSLTKHVYHEYPARENDAFNAIKNDRNLNSLEKSIMKESLKTSMAASSGDIVATVSTGPKLSGTKARLLKSCRTINRLSSRSSTPLLQQMSGQRGGPKAAPSKAPESAEEGYELVDPDADPEDEEVSAEDEVVDEDADEDPDEPDDPDEAEDDPDEQAEDVDAVI